MLKTTILITSSILSMQAFATDDTLPKEFTAKYDAYYKGDKVGYLRRSLKHVKDNKYQLVSDSNIDGYYGFIPVEDRREEVSDFYIDEKTGLFYPNQYVMERSGTWLDFTMKINFDYEKELVNFSYKDRKAEKPLVGNVLDNALYQLRLQYEIKNGKEQVKNDVAYKTGFRDFNFSKTGEEVISTAYDGQVNSYKFIQVRDNKPGEKKGISSWFDPNNDYIMNKLIYFNKKGNEEARFELAEYSTN